VPATLLFRPFIVSICCVAITRLDSSSSSLSATGELRRIRAATRKETVAAASTAASTPMKLPRGVMAM